MAEDKIEVIEIDLDIDIEEEIRSAAKSISPDTKGAIQEAVEEASKKAEKNKQKREAAELKIKQDEEAITNCMELLIGSSKEKPVSSGSLIEASQIENLSGLILRIKNHLKKNQPDYTLEKKKISGKNYYYLTS